MTNRKESHLAELLPHGGQLFVGGDWVKPSSDALIDVVMPSTEEIFFRVAGADEADMNRAVAAARAAFDRGEWPRLSHSQRAAYLIKLAEGLEARQAAAGEIWTSETGVVAGIAQHSGFLASSFFRYYASLADTFAFEERHEPGQGKAAFLVREPVGVAAVILPWNAPLGLLSIKTAPALLAGCTVVIKMAPEAPTAGYLIAQIAKEIGLPPGVINVVTADREVSELLVRHPGVDKVTFTGSTAAGRRIGSICGGRIARCTLELGGKSPAIVLDDYDIETVAQTISGSARMMTGQVCASLTRIIVSRNRHDDLVEALAAAFSKTRVGDPFDDASDMGPLAMARQRDRVESYIAKGREEGAVLATGGGRPPHLNRGYYIEPTVFGNVDNAMTIAREEIFGPVLSVIPADSEKQAIEIANDSDYGLNASVFTNDATRAYQVARQLRSGTVGHNAERMSFSIAFGGFKQSGIGREGGVEGLMPFLETKTIIMDGEPNRDRPWG